MKLPTTLRVKKKKTLHDSSEEHFVVKLEIWSGEFERKVKKKKMSKNKLPRFSENGFMSKFEGSATGSWNFFGVRFMINFFDV